MSTVYLIRHGQASFGADDYDALSPLGFEQSKVLGETLAPRLAGHARLQVFSGSMRRHRETAATCLAAMAHAIEPEVDAGFNEFDHEDVLDAHAPHWRDRGVMRSDLAAAPDPHRAFQAVFEPAFVRWTSGAFDADYREPWSAFRVRCETALANAGRRLAPEDTALVFTSGGAIAALCLHLMNLSVETAMRLNWRFANAGITKLSIGRSGAQVVSFNEHGHFEGERRALLTFR
jgi:broad specificity phosphatase PhoE